MERGTFAVLKALVEHLLRILGPSRIKATNVATSKSEQAEDVEEGPSSKRLKLEEDDTSIFNTEEVDLTADLPTELIKVQETTHQLPQLVVTRVCPGHICLYQSYQPSTVNESLEQAKYMAQEEVKTEMQANQKELIMAEYRVEHQAAIEQQAHEEMLAELKADLKDEARKAEKEELKASILQSEREQIAKAAYEQGTQAKKHQITQMLGMQAP